MLKLSIIFTLLASIIWRTTPTDCRQTQLPHTNVNQITAMNVENYMDTAARPCDNFYQYACGRWYQKHIEQLDFGDTLGLLDYELNRKLEHFLKKPQLQHALNSSTGSDESEHTTASTLETTEASDDAAIYSKVRTYFRACKKIKPYNLKKYLQLIQPGFGTTWFVITHNRGKKWQADKFDWLMAIAKLRLYGLNGVLLKEEVLPRWDESNSNSIYLDKPNLADTEPMGMGAMVELLLDIGQTKRLANEIARQLDGFEQQLHKLHEIEDEEGAKEMQLGYLQEYMPELAWLDFLKELKGPSTNLATTVIIQNIPYMRALVKLLREVPKETICNYLMLKFLLYLKQQGPAEISKQECISSLRRVMPLAMSYIIGTHYYKDAAQTDESVQLIFTNLKQKFYEIISDNRLQLSRPIVESLLAKMHTMRLQLGNSPRNASPDYYDDYYERVELDPNNFYVNQLSLLRLAVEKSHESLALSFTSNFTNADSNDTYISVDGIGSSSSPYYVKPKNLIIVPYGFLQMPVYHRNMHNIFKYSVLGFTLAHELLHGFDSSGIDYDNVGNIMGPSEDIAANQRFMNGLRCMQNELATGSRSLNEKLADYEGFRLTYETFFNGNFSLGTSSSAPLLPQFTRKQLFFINFAQFFCGKVHRGVRQSAFLEHALDELRVLQTLANFEEFSREFSCDRRAKMQSKHRCRLW